jgi:hypothetical protein
MTRTSITTVSKTRSPPSVTVSVDATTATVAAGSAAAAGIWSR